MFISRYIWNTCSEMYRALVYYISLHCTINNLNNQYLIFNIEENFNLVTRVYIYIYIITRLLRTFLIFFIAILNNSYFNLHTLLTEIRSSLNLIPFSLSPSLMHLLKPVSCTRTVFWHQTLIRKSDVGSCRGLFQDEWD